MSNSGSSDLYPLPPVVGTVYGAALNFRGVVDGLGDALAAPPYVAPPRAPVLYIKPRNTHLAHGHTLALAAGVETVAIGGTLGLVFGRSARSVSVTTALDYLAGYVVVNDVHVPHTSYYRPALKQQCQDGFCPMGPVVVARNRVSNPDALSIRIYVNGQLRLTTSTAELVRSVPQLIADVSAFMTLSAGDMLLIGVPSGAPTAHAGDTMRVEIDGVGAVENLLTVAGSKVGEAA